MKTSTWMLLAGCLTLAACEETPPACTDPSCAAGPDQPTIAPVAADPDREQPNMTPSAYSRLPRQAPE